MLLFLPFMFRVVAFAVDSFHTTSGTLLVLEANVRYECKVYSISFFRDKPITTNDKKSMQTDKNMHPPNIIMQAPSDAN